LAIELGLKDDVDKSRSHLLPPSEDVLNCVLKLPFVVMDILIKRIGLNKGKDLCVDFYKFY